MKNNTKLLKKLCFSFLLLTASPAFAQLSVSAQQILMPKKVYIGDTAELRCTFNSDLDLFKVMQKNETKDFSITGFTSELNEKEYDIKQIKFSNLNTNFYSLSVTFVAWKTGTIRLPAYDVVYGFCQEEDYENLNNSALILSFDDINIVSLTEQNSISSPKGALSPLLLPGTTYKIYGIIILLVLLLISLIEAVIHHKKIETFIHTQKLLAKYRKNKKLTLKELDKLLESEKSDKEIAAELQKLMRTYMELRFDYPFSKCGASEIMKGFYTATCGLAAESKETAVENIAAFFIRTDFIRYSNNSFGETKSSFNDDEKKEIIMSLKEAVETIETPEQKTPEEVIQEVQNV